MNLSDVQSNVFKIKRHYMKDILKYNCQLQRQKKQDQKNRQQMRFYFEKKKQQNQRLQQVQQHNQITRRRVLQRQNLKKQYDRQVAEKQQKKIKQKNGNIRYARIEDQHMQEFQERRISDLLRVYNRKSFVTSQPHSSFQISQNERFNLSNSYLTKPSQQQGASNPRKVSFKISQDYNTDQRILSKKLDNYCLKINNNVFNHAIVKQYHEEQIIANPQYDHSKSKFNEFKVRNIDAQRQRNRIQTEPSYKMQQQEEEGQREKSTKNAKNQYQKLNTLIQTNFHQDSLEKLQNQLANKKQIRLSAQKCVKTQKDQILLPKLFNMVPLQKLNQKAPRYLY